MYHTSPITIYHNKYAWSIVYCIDDLIYTKNYTYIILSYCVFYYSFMFFITSGRILYVSAVDLNKHIKLGFKKKKIYSDLKKKNVPFMSYMQWIFLKELIEKTLSKTLQVQKLILHLGASWLEKCNFRIKDWSTRTKVIAGNPLCLQTGDIKCHP